MKYLLPFCLSVFLLLTGLKAKDDQYEYEIVARSIENSFKKGSSDDLGVLMNDQLELLIDSEQVSFNSIPANHAGLILASFFKKYPPIYFTFEFEGDSSETVKYAVASYQSSNTDFSIYLLMSKTPENGFLIKTLQIREK